MDFDCFLFVFSSTSSFAVYFLFVFNVLSRLHVFHGSVCFSVCLVVCMSFKVQTASQVTATDPETPQRKH